MLGTCNSSGSCCVVIANVRAHIGGAEICFRVAGKASTKWLRLPSPQRIPQRVRQQIEMVIWEQGGNWSQWLWILRLGKSVRVWQCTSCVAVSVQFIFHYSGRKIERESERETRALKDGIDGGGQIHHVLGCFFNVFAFSRLPQRSFIGYSLCSWSMHIIVIKASSQSKCKQRQTQAKSLWFYGAAQCKCGTNREDQNRQSSRSWKILTKLNSTPSQNALRPLKSLVTVLTSL